MAKVGSPSASGTYSYNQLRSLWIKAGGGRSWSYVMAAIAMAESHGNPHAHHVDSNGSVDYGLWQINSVHGYTPQSSYDPEKNAKQAVAVFKSSGPGAWSTYKNGDYKKYMPSGKSSPTPSFGIYTKSDYAGTDQGVDYKGKGIVPALDQGLITDIGTTHIVETGNKTWHYVIYRLQSGPYKGRYVYAVENIKPTVHVGENVAKGQEIAFAPGNYPWTETGFNRSAKGWDAFGNLNGPQPSGKAMKAYIDSIIGAGASVSGNDPRAGGVNSGNATPSAIANDITGAVGGWFSGIESLGYQILFGLIGVILIVAGLGVIAWAIMGRVGAPGIIGMAQQQMRINQSANRIGESQRASMVRESQAERRLALQERPYKTTRN